MDYVVYLGFFKLLEFIFSLISWVLFTDLYDGKWSGADDREEFLFAFTIIAWFFSLIWFLFNIWLKNRSFGSLMHLVFGAIHFVLGLIVLAAGSWAADHGMKVDDLAGANGVEKYKSAAAFGIITGIVFVLDALVHVLVGQSVYGKDETETEAESAAQNQEDTVA